VRNGLSNARAEQVNVQSRLVTRRGFGYHSPWAVTLIQHLEHDMYASPSLVPPWAEATTC
jgi:hypothetical protein